MRPFYHDDETDYDKHVQIYHQTGHPVYRSYTLYFNGERGFGVVKQYFSKRLKCYWWDNLASPLAFDIFKNENFWEYFDKVANEPDENGEYPIIQVRKVMYALKMPPERKKFWETVQ